MAQVVVIYDEQRLWTKPRMRPTLELYVHGPQGKTARIGNALIDTGADKLILPRGVANHLGINLTTAPSKKAKIVGGSITMRQIKSLRITVENKSVDVACLVYPGNTTTLLGREAALAVFENYGFEKNSWMFKQIP